MLRRLHAAAGNQLGRIVRIQALYPSRPSQGIWDRPGLAQLLTRPIDHSEASRHETHLSTQPDQARPYPWLSCANGDSFRTQGHQRPARQRPRPIDPLTCSHGIGSRPCGRALPRSARLVRRDDFGRVFQGPTRYSDRYFTVLSRPGPGPGARLGLAIGKKAARRAVDRNRLKRQVREAFRRRRTELGAVDVVVTARAAAVHAANKTLRSALDTLLERVASSSNG